MSSLIDLVLLQEETYKLIKLTFLIMDNCIKFFPLVMMPAYKHNRLYAAYFIIFTFIGK